MVCCPLATCSVLAVLVPNAPWLKNFAWFIDPNRPELVVALRLLS